jgi:hypothetical protein
MQSKNTNCNKGEVLHRESFFKAGVNFIRGNHQLFGGGNPVGNYRVKLNQNQIDGIKTVE